MGHNETLGPPYKIRFHKDCGSIRRLQVSPHRNHVEQMTIIQITTKTEKLESPLSNCTDSREGGTRI